MNARQRRVQHRAQARELADRKALNRFYRDHGDDPSRRDELDAMHREVIRKWGRP